MVIKISLMCKEVWDLNFVGWKSICMCLKVIVVTIGINFVEYKTKRANYIYILSAQNL